MLLPPPSVTNCHTFSDPLPFSSVTYFMDGPQVYASGLMFQLEIYTAPTKTVYSQARLIKHKIQCSLYVAAMCFACFMRSVQA